MFVKSSRVRKTRKAFSQKEDEMLKKIVEEIGDSDWNEVAKLLPGRNARQCRDRWRGYIRPDLISSAWTAEEEYILMQKVAEVGPKWIYISQSLPGRSEAMIKNKWKSINEARSNFGVAGLAPQLNFTKTNVAPIPVYPQYVPVVAQPVVMTIPVAIPAIANPVPCAPCLPPVEMKHSETSTEPSMSDQEPLTTKQELDALFSSLSLSRIRNGRS